MTVSGVISVTTYAEASLALKLGFKLPGRVYAPGQFVAVEDDSVIFTNTLNTSKIRSRKGVAIFTVEVDGVTTEVRASGDWKLTLMVTGV